MRLQVQVGVYLDEDKHLTGGMGLVGVRCTAKWDGWSAAGVWKFGHSGDLLAGM